MQDMPENDAPDPQDHPPATQLEDGVLHVPQLPEPGAQQAAPPDLQAGQPPAHVVAGGGEMPQNGNAVQLLALTPNHLLMPLANVAKLMAQQLPANAKITKESKHAMQELVNEVILFVSREAKESVDGNRAMQTEDLMSACRALDLGEFADVVEAGTSRETGQEMQQSTSHEAADDSLSSSLSSSFSSTDAQHNPHDAGSVLSRAFPPPSWAIQGPGLAFSGSAPGGDFGAIFSDEELDALQAQVDLDHAL